MEKIDAIYARQSVDKTDSISIESQIEFCRYETRGNPFRVFQDKGYSGKNTERPEFQKMLSAIRKGEINRVICYKLDRCSRSILDFATLMEEFQEYNVEFVSCTEKFDTSTPMGRAMLNICIVFAQLERETIQQRVSDAYHARNIKGFYMGGKVPFGYRLEPYILDGKRTSRYEINEEEADILKFMYAIYERPESSLGDIVHALEQAGIRHPRKENGRWSRSHIGRMLQNPVYVRADLDVYDFYKHHGVQIYSNPEDFIGTNGCYLYSGKEIHNHNCCLDGCQLVIAPHRGIIPSDVWLRCRKKQKITSEPIRQYKIRNTWLAGKMKCSKCGYAVVIRKTTKKNGRIFRYYVCSESSKSCEGIRSVKADFIEQIIFEEMLRKLELFPTLHPPGDENIDPEIRRLQVLIAQIDQQIENAAQKALEATGILVQYLSDKVSELHKQKETYSTRIKELEERSFKLQSGANRAVDYGTVWNHLLLEDKQALADTLISNILLSENEITINWRI